MPILSTTELITSHEATVSGFLAQALHKSREAIPYVQEAYNFSEKLATVASVEELLHRQDITEQLLYAVGFSEKAMGHFKEAELVPALQKALPAITSKAGNNWRQEILYRFLLTRGDSLGGRMRNLTGALAGAQFAQAIVDALKRLSVTPVVEKSPSNHDRVQSLIWEDRALTFNRKPSVIGKNIDVILLSTATSQKPLDERLKVKEDYLACGELKGGIDPAGADEHWKTAKSALDRIREKFKVRRPMLFFIGAAIETAMAEEIFKDLQKHRLDQAANLTVPAQVKSLADWLVAL